ncbi:similar to Saccharomyces cerevisiae YPL134C ODC1 Mitochondrial inner membrane transporter [Maudiozyma saulgeensis]|uniref:Similar to Saccharomyces cerevisiae YPL134C ODC1 Mitochondrial inner membrane transporter n=1 Tax=Maudiozyma saulgeensis TaxID=1789683 RepID=A0A1X7R9T6_9SACH|nr:similar to Saccharomyces cerevisiae YPL134C ODC1 Mitochondrial inner membrane transporter [Kazachstania saulgeensis]
MSTKGQKQQLPFRYAFLAGSIAGVSETVAMYPLDVIKTRFQLQSVTTNRQLGLVSYITKVLRKEGLRHIFRGITSPVLMEVPKRATKFSCNSKYQTFLQRIFGQNTLTQSTTIIAGAMAGSTEAIIIVPFELVKIRMQQVSSVYKTPADCLKSIIRKDGIFAMYTGLEATMWRSSVWNSGYFGLMHFVKSVLPHTENKRLQTSYNFIAGALGGSLSCFLSVPFDVVKSQIQSVNGSYVTRRSGFYGSAIFSIIHMYKADGIFTLYRGITPILCRYAPGGGILSSVYNKVNDLLSEYHLQGQTS